MTTKTEYYITFGVLLSNTALKRERIYIVMVSSAVTFTMSTGFFLLK